jgi:hypothetical protein
MITLLALLLSLVIWGFIFYVLWWGIGRLALPEPFNKGAVVVLVVASIVVVIGLLIGSISPFPFLVSLGL